ncbi:MAG: hypothetical protein KDA65_14320 [Planctomycetaceae bacterium]|nr:hypothetical protein [Planctomycetaceae bacterium]
MVGWFKSAIDLLNGKSTRPVERLLHHCPCGEYLRIDRTRETQRRSCPVCGTRFLVLPISPFPIPRPPKGYVPATPPEPDLAEDAIDVLSEEEEKTEDQVVTSDGATIATVTDPVSLSLEERVPLRQRFRRQFTLLRLTIAGIVLLVGVSGYLYWWRTQVEQARQDYTASATQAFEALVQNNHEMAIEQFEIASRAATILDLDDARSNEVHLYNRELSLSKKLSPQTFPKFLEELQKLLVIPVKDESPAYEEYAGGEWFLLDLFGKVVEEEGSRWLLVEAPINQKKENFQVQIRLPENAAINRDTNALNEMRFLLVTRGNRLALKKKPKPHWILYCEETFFWQHPETLPMVGLFDDDPEFQTELEQLLKSQSTDTVASNASSTEPEEE